MTGMMRPALIAIAAITLAVALTACSSGEVYPGYAEHLEDQAAEDAAANDVREQEAMADQYSQEGMWEPSWAEGATGWTCTYVPTMNEDWHDDAVCSNNGNESHRPYLRDWDDFVTEAELMESAREYAAELNAG